jgi:hypothetical protein
MRRTTTGLVLTLSAIQVLVAGASRCMASTEATWTATAKRQLLDVA